MSFGSILSGIYRAITPSRDGGAVFSRSSYQPQKRKPQPGDPDYQPSNIRVGVANPTQRVVVDQPIQTQKPPENIFDTLNKNLMLGQNKPGVVPVFNNTNAQPPQTPAPGTVVKPTIPVTTAPAQTIRVGDTPITRSPGARTNELPEIAKPKDNRFWQKFGRGLKTTGETAVGTVANVPEVGLAAARAGTGIVQGVGNLPHDITALTAGGTQQVQKHFNNPVTRQVNRGFQDINTGVKTATHYAVNDVFDPLNRGLDTGAKMYERNVPGATGGAGVYKNTQIPINILAGLLTLGSSSAGTAGEAGSVAEEANNVSKLGRVKAIISDFLNKPLTSNENNIIAKTGRAVTAKGRPVAEVLNAPIKSTSKLINRFRPNSAERSVIDSGEIGNLLTDAEATDLATTQVPVATGIDVNAPPSEPVNVPVRNANTPTPIIQEIGGDAKTATTNAQAAQNAINVRRVEAAKNVSTGLPDKSVEGILPPKPTYLGEAKGPTQIEINAERTMLDDALANKEITKTEHKAANKALDNTPVTDAPPPKGKPITVQEVKGIDVADQTNVPQNLPETPGQVRVTEATAPSNTRSEAVAAQATTAPVKGEPSPDIPETAVTAPATRETLPRPDESDETFLKRVATDMQSNIKRAVTSLKTTKQMTKAQRAEQAAAGQKAYEEAKAAGLTKDAQDAARKTAMRGGFDRQDYAGSPVHSEDEQRLRDMVDEHYKDMPYQAGNVRDAFTKLFHTGEEGHWASGEKNHIIPSDIKNIRKFLNESVPNPDGNGGLGDFAETAIKELAAAEPSAGKIANAIGLQRALRFTADISATGRQALPGALSHPIEFAKAAKKSFEVMFSHEKYQKYVSELSNSKEANYINDRLGAYLSAMNDDISKADDIYRNSGWAHKIPGVNQVVAASERQYNTILSEMRRQAGQRFIDAAGGIGNLEKVASDSGNPESFLKAIGTVANVNTGRGFGKALDTGASKILSDVLVSPRGLAARLQRFNPIYYKNLLKDNPAAGKEALRSLGIQTAVTVSALGAASKAGMYEDGQIKVGNTRYDVTGGAANMIRTAVRVVQFMSGDRATTGKDNAENELYKWSRNQLSPFLASALDTIGIHPDKKTGEWVNHFGDKVTAGDEILNNITPVNASQVNTDLQLQTSPGQTAANAALNTLGVGVNTYESSADKKAAGGPSNKIDTKAGVGGTEDYAGFKATVPKEGSTLTQLSDGSYAYSINGETHQTNKLKDAQEAIAKADFTQSGENSKILKDKYYYKDENGDTKVMPKYKHEFDVQDSQNQLDMYMAKDNEDYGAWNESATKQLKALETLRDKYNKDSQEDKVDDVQKKIETLRHDMKKYAGYGGSFTKPKKGRAAKGIDTSFGTLKASSFAPQVQQYQTIDSKSGSVPHISIVRPNIVHKIGSSGQNKTMAAIDNILKLAQKTYYSINGAQNDDTGDDLLTFENDFIMGFNLWKEEFEAEAYWNKVRVDDLVLATIGNTTKYSFELPDDYRTPVIQQNKYLKFISDGIVIAKFKMIDPNQRQVDSDIERPDRATFVGRNIVLSRAPRDTEVGSRIVLDVVEFIPDLTRTDDSAIDLLPNSQVAVLGVAKNNTLADVTKVSLSKSFSQKYTNELNKAIAINNQSNEVDEMQREDYSNIGGIW